MLAIKSFEHIASHYEFKVVMERTWAHVQGKLIFMTMWLRSLSK